MPGEEFLATQLQGLFSLAGEFLKMGPSSCDNSCLREIGSSPSDICGRESSLFIAAAPELTEMSYMLFAVFG